MANRYLFLTLGFFVSAMIVFTAWTIARQRTTLTGKAFSTRDPESRIFSVNNSYIFASPITASADGASPIRISVFLMNNQGLGVAGQKVSLDPTPEINYSYLAETTDAFGRAIFDAVSQIPGDYTISASVSNLTLSQKVIISFY